MAKAKEQPSAFAKMVRLVGWGFTFAPVYLFVVAENSHAWVPVIKQLLKH